MAGKPGTTLVDDDDLVVDLEQGADDFAPPTEREEIEPARAAPIESPTLPDDSDDGSEPSRAPAAQGRDGDEPADDQGGGDEESDAYARIQAAEEHARNVEAHAIWETANQRADLADMQRANAQVGLGKLEMHIEQALAYISAAREAGDAGAEARGNQDLQKMYALKGELETGARAIPSREAILAEGRAKAQQIASAQSRGKRIGNGIEARHPLAERWAGANGWIKTNARANQHVIATSQKMTEEGYDPNSPGFYAELGRRVQLAYPNLKVQALQAQKRGAGKGQVRTPAAPSRSSVGGGSTVTRQADGKRRYTITPGEQAKMKNMRLDPGNPAHRRAWAKSRLESSARERQQGA